MEIFMFCGKARSGKDTSALILKKILEEKNKKVIILQYSYYIKEFAKKIMNWDGSEETKPRSFLQELGTDIIRKKIDNLFFIKRLLEDLKVYEFYFDYVIISDVRFAIEIDEPRKKYPVKAIKITREDKNEILSLKQQNHSTETGLDNYNNFDYEIKNDFDLEYLEQEIRKLVIT